MATYGQWIPVTDPATNATYYYNTATGQTSWTPPAAAPSPAYAPQFQAQAQAQAQPPTSRRAVVMGVAIYAYVPTGRDPREMAIAALDQIEVYPITREGWLMGRCVRTGQVGICPTTYVRAVPR